MYKWFTEKEGIVVIGDINAKVGNKEVYRVVGKYGVPEVNENCKIGGSM